MCVWVFMDGTPGPAAMPALFFAPLPALLWAAVRFGTTGTSASLLAVALVTIGGATLGRGPFVSSSPESQVLALQLYLIALAIPLLGLCAVVEERVQAEDVLREAHEARNELVHLSRAAILGELAGALAHELNQPLAAILANARAGQRLLEREAIDVKELREILDDVAADDRRAGEVIRRLHALLKKGDLQPRPLDLNEVVIDVLELMHSDLIQRSVLVDARLAPALPTVVADPVQLQQVLLNLFINGCDAMSEQDRADRRLTVATTQQVGGAVRIAVADSGTGIPVDKLDRVFEPFYTSKDQGLGLGLSICRSIVRAHGGRLWAANNPQGGATFYVELDHGGQGGTRMMPPVAERTASRAVLP
jgi:two-component system sensor kinase FixL